MTITQQDCEKVLSDMPAETQAKFLAKLGHFLTVIAREAYEFQGPGVTNPRMLRDFNELHHRIYSQINGLVSNGTANFPPDVLASWLCGEERAEEFQNTCLMAFEQCLQRFKGQ
jgi:hypothetical protein